MLKLTPCDLMRQYHSMSHSGISGPVAICGVSDSARHALSAVFHGYTCRVLWTIPNSSSEGMAAQSGCTEGSTPAASLSRHMFPKLEARAAASGLPSAELLVYNVIL